MQTAHGEIRIGISGWRYAPWRGVFYPSGLAQRHELAFASRMLGTIEINGSFYSLQRPSSWREWHDETPEDFVFAVKGPKYLTHYLRLKEPATPLASFLASGVLALGAKLGPATATSRSIAGPPASPHGPTAARSRMRDWRPTDPRRRAPGATSTATSTTT